MPEHPILRCYKIANNPELLHVITADLIYRLKCFVAFNEAWWKHFLVDLVVFSPCPPYQLLVQKLCEATQQSNQRKKVVGFIMRAGEEGRDPGVGKF